MAKEPWGITGAFVFWMFKGFRGKFEDEFHEKYNVRNMIVVLIIAAIALIIIFRNVV